MTMWLYLFTPTMVKTIHTLLAVSVELLANTINASLIISELTPMWLSPLIRN